MILQIKSKKNKANGPTLAGRFRNIARSSTSRLETFLLHRKLKKTTISDRSIEDVCHCRFYPASRFKVRCILGPFFFFLHFLYWISDITSQLLQETRSHHDLVGQEIHTHFQKIKTKNKRDKSHHTRYGHTNERTTIKNIHEVFPKWKYLSTNQVQK